MMKHLKQLNGIRGLLPVPENEKAHDPVDLLPVCDRCGTESAPPSRSSQRWSIFSPQEKARSPLFWEPVSCCTLCSSALCTRRSMRSASYTAIQTPCCQAGSSNRCVTTAMTWALESYKPYKEERRRRHRFPDLWRREAVVRAVAGPLNGLLPMVLKMIGSVVMMFVWSPVLGAISLALVLPLYAASKRVAVKKQGDCRRAARGQRSSRGAVGDLLYCIPIIKAWGKRAF